MNASIAGLLNMTNNQLSRLFDRYGPDVRKELKERLARGEVYIPCGDCEGFDPVTGCPGHSDKKRK